MMAASALTPWALPSAVAANDGPAIRWTPRAISTDQYESTPTFTPDGREMFFMSSDKQFDNYSILWSQCRNGSWSKPVAPPFALPVASAFDADPFVSADGKRLYFISTRQGSKPAEADFDIWYVDRERDGRWLRAKRMPEPVNSEGSELLPRATPDGRLYFGSDRAGGYGKGDIYVASPAADGAWSVANVGPPVSTAAFEYEADVAQDGKTMIVVADRGERSHLYRYTRTAGGWTEVGRIAARDDVFQVGPLLSPNGDRLLFAQASGDLSGEMFLIDLSAAAQASWPPRCGS